MLQFHYVFKYSCWVVGLILTKYRQYYRATYVMFFLAVDIPIQKCYMWYELHGKHTLLLTPVNCCLVFGYCMPASRIMHLQGSLFLLFKTPKVWTVIHGENGCLDLSSVDNRERKLSEPWKEVFCAEAGIFLAHTLFPGKQWHQQ